MPRPCNSNVAIPALLLVLTASAGASAAPPSQLWTEKPQATALDPDAPVSMRAFADLARELSPAIVNISVKRTLENPIPFMPAAEGQGLGSGFIIHRDGLVLTNAHVVDGAEEIAVKLANEQEYRATVVGIFKPLDIALLSFAPQTDDPALVVAPLGDSERVEIGEWVIAIGNPFGLNHTVTAGIVSAKGRRDITPGNETNLARFIQTDASINPGNSGGPLINIRGEVIGINTAINAAGQGIGFAVPIDMVKTILPQLATGRVNRSYLGVVVSPVNRELRQSLGLSRPGGALVSRVATGSPAAAAGITPGDIIMSFDGVDISHWEDLPWLASVAGLGKSATLEVQRNGRSLKVPVVLAAYPEQTAAPDEAPAAPTAGLGIAVSPLTAEHAKKLKLEAGTGVLVTTVETPSLGRALGVREGDVILEVNGVSVATPEAFLNAVGKLSRGSKLTLSMRRGQMNMVKRLVL